MESGLFLFLVCALFLGCGLGGVLCLLGSGFCRFLRGCLYLPFRGLGCLLSLGLLVHFSAEQVDGLAQLLYLAVLEVELVLLVADGGKEGGELFIVGCGIIVVPMINSVLIWLFLHFIVFFFRYFLNII